MGTCGPFDHYDSCEGCIETLKSGGERCSGKAAIGLTSQLWIKICFQKRNGPWKSKSKMTTNWNTNWNIKHTKHLTGKVVEIVVMMERSGMYIFRVGRDKVEMRRLERIEERLQLY